MSELNVSRHTMSNGLTLIVVPLNHLHRVHVSLTFNVGSRYETPEVNGVSHFLEHMMFRGTRKYPSLTELAKAFEDIGGNLDGSTGREYTIYETYLPVDRLSQGVERFAEFILKPRLVGVKLERQIILEELKMELNEDGEWVDSDSVSKRLLFDGHQMGQTVLGSPETLKAITSRALRDHYKTYYCAANAVLTVVGRIDAPGQLVSDVERLFAGMPRGERAEPEAVSFMELVEEAPQLKVVNNDALQTEVCLVMQGLPEHDPMFPALEIATRIIDDGLSTRLPRRMIDELGLAYSANGYLEIYRDTSVWSLNVVVSHGKVRRAVDELGEVLMGLLRGPIADDEFERARNRAIWELTALLDSPRSVSSWVSSGDLSEFPFAPTERLARLRSVKKEDLTAALSRVVKPERMWVVLIGRAGKKLQATLNARLADWGSSPAERAVS